MRELQGVECRILNAEKQHWGETIFQPISPFTVASVWKSTRGLCPKCHTLWPNSQTALCGNHLSTNILYHWVRIVKNLCRERCGKWHTAETGRQYRGQTVFQRTSCFTKIEAFENPCREVWQGRKTTVFLDHLSTDTVFHWEILEIYRESKRKVPSTQLCESTVGKPSFDYYLVSLPWKLLDNLTQPIRKVICTQFCQVALWGAYLSTTISFP